MKNSITLLFVFIFQIVLAQHTNPFNTIKNNPVEYEHKIYSMKSKDSVDYEKGFNRVVIQRKYYPDSFDNYSLKSFDSIVEQKNKSDLVITRQLYFIDMSKKVTLTDEYRYEYNNKKQLVFTKIFKNYALNDVKLELSSTYVYEYTESENIKRILKYESDATIETIIDYTYKNGLPITRTFNYYYKKEDKESLSPTNQIFEFYKCDEKNRLVNKIKQFENQVEKTIRYYSADGKISKIEKYEIVDNNKKPLYYTYKDNKFFNESDPRNKFRLQSTQYYKTFDDFGNVTEVVWEKKKYNDENVLLYFLEKRDYKYKK